MKKLKFIIPILLVVIVGFVIVIALQNKSIDCWVRRVDPIGSEYTFSFGKYKGKRFREMDQYYCMAELNDPEQFIEDIKAREDYVGEYENTFGTYGGEDNTVYVVCDQNEYFGCILNDGKIWLINVLLSVSTSKIGLDIPFCRPSLAYEYGDGTIQEQIDNILEGLTYDELKHFYSFLDDEHVTIDDEEEKITVYGYSSEVVKDAFTIDFDGNKITATLNSYDL